MPVAGDTEGAKVTSQVGAIMRGAMGIAPPPEAAPEAAAPEADASEADASVEAETASEDVETTEPAEAAEGETDSDEPSPEEVQEAIEEHADEEITEESYRAKLAVLSRKAQRLQRARDKALAKAQDLEARAAEAERLGKVASIAKSDPRGALSQLAEMSGVPAEDLLRKVAQQIIESPLTGKPKQSPEKETYTREELDQLLDEKVQRLVQQQQQQGLQRQQRELVSAVLQIPSDEGMAERWPALAATPPARLQYEVEQSVQWAAANRPDLLRDAAEFVGLLDKLLAEEYNSVASRLSRSRKTQATPPERATPAKKTAPAAKPSPTAEAHRSPPDPDMSPEERRRAAAELMRGFLGPRR